METEPSSLWWVRENHSLPLTFVGVGMPRPGAMCVNQLFDTAAEYPEELFKRGKVYFDPQFLRSHIPWSRALGSWEWEVGASWGWRSRGGNRREGERGGRGKERFVHQSPGPSDPLPPTKLHLCLTLLAVTPQWVTDVVPSPSHHSSVASSARDQAFNSQVFGET